MTSWESLIQLHLSVLNSHIPLVETFKNLVMMMSPPRRGDLSPGRKIYSWISLF